jgi:lysophospholipase L1-like esterase
MTDTRIRLALGVALSLSLAANAYLGHSAWEHFKAIQAIRLDPAGAAVYAPDRAKPPVDPPVLVFFGDSRALMWSTPAAAAGYHVTNRGIGNQTTAQILMRVDTDVSPLHPAVVVLEAGVNDLKTISEFPERRAEIVSQCEANLRRIVDGCGQGGATVIVTTVFAIGDVALWRRPFWSDAVRGAVHEVNAFLLTLRRDKVLLFDADPVLGGGGDEIRPAYQLDYLHLSGAGYAALNQKLVPLLSSLPR